MEWMIIVFYVIGFALGMYLGRTLGYDKFYDDVYMRVCRHVQDMCDAMESRLEDDVFETQSHRDMARGSYGAYVEMVDFLCTMIDIRKKKANKVEDGKDE